MKKLKFKKPIEESVEALSASLEGLMHFASAIALIVIVIYLCVSNIGYWLFAVIPFSPIPFAITHYIFCIIKMICKMSRNLEKIATNKTDDAKESDLPAAPPVAAETSEQ